MKKLICLIAVLALAGTACATDWVGGTSDDWSDSTNWSSGLPNASTAGNVNAGSAVIYSGTSAVSWDTSLMPASGVSCSLTIKTGGSLYVAVHSVDLAYNASGTATVTIEAGASADLTGTGNGGLYLARNGVARFNLAGTLDCNVMSMNGNDAILDFATTGQLSLDGDNPANAWGYTTEDYITNGWITDRGVAFGEAGWGTTHGVSWSYDSGSGRTTVVPEPTTIALLSLGGLALIRRKRS